MPDELKSKIADSAEANSRSLHAELLLRLSESFRLNQADADTTQVRLRLAESQLKETVLMQHALHLGNCVTFLLQAIRGPHPKEAVEAFPDLVKIAEDAAEHALKYEKELNPATRLEEYRKAIDEAKDLLQIWRPSMLPLNEDVGSHEGGSVPQNNPARGLLHFDLGPVPKRFRAERPADQKPKKKA